MSTHWRPSPSSTLLLTLSVSSLLLSLPVGQASRAAAGGLTLLIAQTASTNPAVGSDTGSEANSARAIRPGSRGRYVTQIQLMLSQLELYQGDLDGVYSDSTEQAVREFQRDQDLPVTGAVDRETWIQLRDAFIAAAAASTDSSVPSSTPNEAASNESDTPSSDTLTPEASPSDREEPEGGSDESTVSSAPSSDPSSNSTPSNTPFSPESAPVPPPAPVPWVRLSLFMVAIATAFYAMGRISVERRGPRVQWPESKPGPKPAAAEQSAEATAPPGSPNSTAQTPADTPTAQTTTQFKPASQPDSQSGAESEAGFESGLDSGLQAESTVPLKPSAFVTLEPSSLTTTPDINPTTRMARIDIVQELIQELHSPDANVRRKAIWELGQRGTTEAIQPLIDLMVNVDSQQRSLILAAVSEIGVRTLKPLSRALITSLQDESSDVRKNAIRDISRVYELMTQVSTILRHAADDDDTEVRETACWALDQLNRLRIPPALDETSRSPNQISGKTP